MHPLVDHPRASLAALAREWSELDAELVSSSGPQGVRWPANVSLRDFALYQLTPVLVYELEYPRTNRCVFHNIQLLKNVAEKLMIMCGRG